MYCKKNSTLYENFSNVLTILALFLLDNKGLFLSLPPNLTVLDFHGYTQEGINCATDV
jgi:hypothetical protein